MLGKQAAGKVLKRSNLVVGAFDKRKLIGIARAMFDGCEAVIMEFSLELKYQGRNLCYNNGSLMEKDLSGIGKRMGTVLREKLTEMGATVIHCYIVKDCEEKFYRSIGFNHNKGHLVYCIDKRKPGHEKRKRTS